MTKPVAEPAAMGTPAVAPGKVWLVGAGPGDPDLMTVRARRLLESAAVVAYDELVSAAILALAPEGAERIPVGRRAQGRRYHDARIHPVVIERALAGLDVVRLKGGDPLIFGRGGEEAEELLAAGIAFEIVPGISAALGAAAAAGLPLTHRDVASSVTFATAHAADGDEDFAANVTKEGTLVFYMALARVDATCDAVMAAGRAPETPAAVLSRATLPDAMTVVGTLRTIAERAREAGVQAPALLVVGAVVERRVGR
ncbi:MAG TPA: uroporphyrinogen-III C-methyltransferase [Polyangiaceae bacterium]|jgi:uroporphyrin-III C-methyltransferase|nr:uroporphyrinogen-III C-methyltransferase [Polyangiaceae bacterium]